MAIIDRILELMKEKNIKANALANELGLPNSAFSEWKKKKANPSVDVIIKIADYFDVTTDYLLGRTDKRYAQAMDKWAARRTESASEPTSQY